tara:strand:- start:164 stop:391 length:228 start_codon:yes stop_codon:yes gene_type:complete
MGILSFGYKGLKAIKSLSPKKKISTTISSLKGKYNIGNASKIKNKASRANLEASAFNFKQTTKKFKEAVDKLDNK